MASLFPKTSRPTRLAPGATPSIRMLHAAGSAWAEKPLTLYTCWPWPAIVLASRNASSPLVGWPGPSPLKSCESTNADALLPGRMKLTLFGSMPSAM